MGKTDGEKKERGKEGWLLVGNELVCVRAGQSNVVLGLAHVITFNVNGSIDLHIIEVEIDLLMIEVAT